jgi:ABC-type sugar transport system ATPase subunit
MARRIAEILRPSRRRPLSENAGAGAPHRSANQGCVVEFRGVSKAFGGVHAVKAVSFGMNAGEITALVGDNGAGKSTLVKMLGGMYEPDDGEIVVAGQAHDHLTPATASAHGIEVVYQDLALCDNLPTGANIVLGREPKRRFLGVPFLDARRSTQIGKEKLTALGARIPDWDVPVRRLSGGQRQAIAIARAMISGHRLIVLDEPTAALGVRQTRATLELLRNIVREQVAVMLIMHNLDQIFEVSDRIVVLRLGAVTLDTRRTDTSKEEIVAHMAGVAVPQRTGAPA